MERECTFQRQALSNIYILSVTKLYRVMYAYKRLDVYNVCMYKMTELVIGLSTGKNRRFRGKPLAWTAVRRDCVSALGPAI